MGAVMTARERTELAQLCRKRERVAKTMATQRSAELLADFEAKLARQYSWSDNENWTEAMHRASAIVADLNMTIIDNLREIGVPPEFAPSANLDWYARGENAVTTRRTELRKVATSEIAAREKKARTEIERASLETQTQLLMSGLESTEAKRFLDAMPTAEQLMPALDVGEIEKQLRR